MEVRVGAVAALWLIVDGVVGADDVQDVFRQRSVAQWKDAWHTERHAVCRQDLLRHMYWACEKDIYRLSRRGGQDSPGLPFVDATDALSMLRERRRGGEASITRNCCWNPRGCTWEEYAEYCPANRRRRLLRPPR